MAFAPFHYSCTVADLDAARDFYAGVLGCREAASAPTWVDFDFFGHQLSVHLGPVSGDAAKGLVDGHRVPMPHFGVVLTMDAWQALVEQVRAANLEFVFGPTIRYPGDPREQGTFFVRDPSGNALEFKAMRDPALLFAPVQY